MTRKEELIQAIQQSPEEVVSALWETLHVLQQQFSEGTLSTQQESELGSKEQCSQRLHRKQGVLVLETGDSTGFEIKELVHQIREERIQNQMGDLNR
jgi:precorrin-6B methylase 1